ncbi:hypothetical protein EGO53_12760 [Serratia liquefaciens]|uniref:Uncharacterized protein n=2 Tax=Serratia liquefaciens TaxID=614 RepID=A0A515CWT0_SERLI|nr:hypothetical protein EGO53_12760 [Serratia liquefaciens]
MIYLMRAFALLLISFGVLATELKVPASVEKAINDLNVKGYRYAYPNLKIIFKADRVTELLARNVMWSVCATRWDDGEKWPSDAIQKVDVMNQWEVQSYTFKMNGSDCDKYGDLNDGENDKFLTEHMSQYP